jgi:hypothetical protein
LGFALDLQDALVNEKEHHDGAPFLKNYTGWLGAIVYCSLYNLDMSNSKFNLLLMLELVRYKS